MTLTSHPIDHDVALAAATEWEAHPLAELVRALVAEAQHRPPTPADGKLPLYCGACNDVHLLEYLEIERIVYALQGDLVDETMSPTGHSGYEDGEPVCLETVLGGSNDGEVYKEWTDSYVESRVAMQPVDCPLHEADPVRNDAGEITWYEQGPHHHPLCHYYDPDMPWPDGVDSPPAVDQRHVIDVLRTCAEVLADADVSDADETGPIVDRVITACRALAGDLERA